MQKCYDVQCSAFKCNAKRHVISANQTEVDAIQFRKRFVTIWLIGVVCRMNLFITFVQINTQAVPELCLAKRVLQHSKKL